MESLEQRLDLAVQQASWSLEDVIQPHQIQMEAASLADGRLMFPESVYNLLLRN